MCIEITESERERLIAGLKRLQLGNNGDCYRTLVSKSPYKNPCSYERVCMKILTPAKRAMVQNFGGTTCPCNNMSKKDIIHRVSKILETGHFLD